MEKLVEHAEVRAKNEKSYEARGTIIAVTLALIGAVIVWTESASTLLGMAEVAINSGSVELGRQEIAELIYTTVATLGFSVVMGLVLLASPARLRSVGTLIAVIFVVTSLAVFYILLGGSFPVLTVIGIGLPLIGSMVQDFLSGR